MAYTSQQPRSDHHVVLSPKKQKALATFITDADLTRHHRADQSEYMNISSVQISDTGKAGLPGGSPTFNLEVQRDGAMALKNDIGDVWFAAWAAAFCLGSATVTGAGPYTWAIVPLLNGADPVLTTVYEEAGASLKKKFVDVGINKFQISSNSKRGALSITADLMGTGQELAGAITSIPALPSIYTLLNNSAAIAMGAPGALATLDKNRISAWDFSAAQNLARQDVAGNGNYGRILRGMVDPAFSLTAALDGAADDLMSLVRNRTLQALTVTVATLSNASLTISLPNFYWAQATPIVDSSGNQIAIKLDADKNSILKAAGSALVTLTVICDEQNFLVAAT